MKVQLPTFQTNPERSYPVYPEACSDTTGQHSLLHCFEKELEYAQAFIATPMRVEMFHKVFVITPASKVVFSSSLFRQYSCLDFPGCHQCCFRAGYWNLFLTSMIPPDLKERIGELGREVIIRINGTDQSYHVHDHTDHRCEFLSETHSCSIHTSNPMTCMFPLVMFRPAQGGVIQIRKHVFGRNHKMGCPATFKPYERVEDFESDTVSRLKRYASYLDALSVEHHGWDLVDRVIKRARIIIGRHERRFV